MVGLGALSAGLLMTPSCVLQSACWRGGMLSRRTWTGLRGGPCMPWDVQQSQVPGAAFVLGQFQAQVYRGQRMDWRQPWQEGFGGVGKYEAQHDPSGSQSRRHSQPQWPLTSWAASKAAWLAGWGMCYCLSSPLQWDTTWSSASSSGAPNIRMVWISWNESRRRAMKIIWDLEHLSHKDRWLFSLEREGLKVT